MLWGSANQPPPRLLSLGFFFFFFLPIQELKPEAYIGCRWETACPGAIWQRLKHAVPWRRRCHNCGSTL